MKNADPCSGIFLNTLKLAIIIRGSGGIRKIRWSQEGKGKRGGVRVIYYWKKSVSEIWLLTIYAKNEKATIPGHMLKKIAEEIKNE